MSGWPTRLSTGLVLWVGLWTSGAAAQGDLAQAELLLENAEFEQAADVLESIAESDVGLDRGQVAELLRLRAVVRSALGRDREADRDLASLARVLEGREPGALPETLLRRFERHRRQSRGSIEASVLIQPRAAGEVIVRLQIENDPSGLVRRHELVCHAGGREVAATDADRLTITEENELDCEAVAYGPGDWLAADASTTWRSSEPTGADDGEPDWLERNWPYLAGGAGAAIGLVVIISVIVFATAPTGVSGPMWVPSDMGP